MYCHPSISRSSLVFRFVSLVLVLPALLFAPRDAKAGVFLDAMAVFEFETSKDEPVDKYFFVIRDISTKILVSELEGNPLVGRVLFVPRSKLPEGREKEFAEMRGVNYYITGQFMPVRENVIIRAKWVDLRRGVEGEEQTILGKKDLEDFDLVAKKVQRLSKKLVLKIVSEVPSQRILISCFRGGKEAGFSFLDRYITLELPYYLGRSLERGRIKPDRFTIEGLTLREYNNECLIGKGTKDLRGIRYVISATIIREEDQLMVKTLLFDQSAGRTIAIPLSEKIPKKDIEFLPQIIADYLAGPLLELAIEIDEKVLGPDHPDVATALNKLAGLHYIQGDYIRAEKLYQRSLAIRERALGPDHPDVATSLENYAALLRKTKRATEAEKIESRAKEIRAKLKRSQQR